MKLIVNILLWCVQKLTRCGGRCAPLLAVFLAGCSHNFYRDINGVSNSVALTLPEEDAFKVQVLEYLSGSKTVVRDPSSIVHEYTTVSSNDYFGCIHVRELRRSRIEIEPSTNATGRVDGPDMR